MKAFWRRQRRNLPVSAVRPISTKLTAKAKWYYTVNDDADIIASLGGSAGHMFNTGGQMEVFDTVPVGPERHPWFRA